MGGQRQIGYLLMEFKAYRQTTSAGVVADINIDLNNKTSSALLQSSTTPKGRLAILGRRLCEIL